MVSPRGPMAAIPAMLMLLVLFNTPSSGTGPSGHLALPISEELAGEIEAIDIGAPLFDVSLSTIDGRQWCSIELEGGITPPSSGAPSVPYLSCPLEIPYEVTDIRLIRSDPMRVQLPAPLKPGPSVIKFTKDNLDELSRSSLEVDEASYSLYGPFPSEPLLWTHAGYRWKEGVRYSVCSVAASPFDYDPVEGSLTYYKGMELQVVRSQDVPQASFMLTRTTAPSGWMPGTELLMIAYDPFIGELGDLTEWKKEKGIRVQVVGYSEVDDEYPSLNGPASIWQYIHDGYFGDGQKLKYVLLAGEIKYVPTRMVTDLDPYGSEPSTLPSDTYYCCLDGTYQVWDQDGDGRWGERNDIGDAVPDVYVSRISLDSEAEALNWAKKVVAYEKNPPVGSWAGTAGLFGSTTHFQDDGPDQCEYLWSTYMDDVFTTPDKYYSYGQVQQSAGAEILTYQNIQQGFVSGFSTVVYMGHGLSQLWSEGTQDQSTIIYTVNEASTLSQSPKLPFITAMSCETNWFDGDSWEAISEGFTENPSGGSIAYAGAVRTTEGGIGYDQYLPGAPGIQEDILRMMRSGFRSSGAIFQKAKEYYYLQWGAYFSTYPFAYNAWMEHNILGPAETEIWVRPPLDLQASYTFTEDRYSNFTVHVTDGSNQPLKDAVVSVYSKTTDVVSRSLTDSTGKATVPFEIMGTSYGKLTVTKTGYRPYQKQVLLQDTTPPTIEATKQIEYPDGSNGWYTVDPGLKLVPSEPSDISFRWNGGQTEPYIGTMEVPIGDNALETWAVDGSGNEGEVVAVRIKFDPDEPVLTLTVDPDEPDGNNGWYITQPVVSTVLRPADGAPQRVDYWWDRGTRQQSNGTIFVIEGDHELHLQAIDDAGNRADEVVMLFKVDSEKPVTALETGGATPNERGWYTVPMTLTLKCEDRTAQTFYRWDGDGQWTTYSSPVEPLQGNHSMDIFSEDSHGNREDVKRVHVPYDIIPPELQLTVSPSAPNGKNGWYIKRPSVAASIVSEETGFTISYQYEGGLQEVYSNSIDIPDGRSTVVFRAIDEAGNWGTPIELSFKVDSKADTTTERFDAGTNNDGYFTELPLITLQAPSGTAIYFRWDGEGTFQPYGSSFYPPGDEGTFRLEYYSIDEAGNTEARKSTIVMVDASGPVVKLNGPAQGSAGEVLSFDLAGTTDGVGVTGYWVDFGDGTKAEWTTEPSYKHSYKSGGTYTIRVKARDAAGHESEVLEWDVVIEDQDGTIFLILGGVLIGALIIISAAIMIVVAKGRHSAHPAPLRPLPHHYHAIRGGAGSMLPPQRVPPAQTRGGGRLIEPAEGLGPRLPGPSQDLSKKGVQFGSSRVTETAPRIDKFIDKGVSRGSSLTSKQQQQGPVQSDPPSPRKPVEIPKPPRSPFQQ